MPRGGPDASRLNRWLQTDRLEYLDRDDVDHLKRRVVRSLDRGGRIFGRHPRGVVREMDATAIDAPDGFYDLAVFALSFHHLPPALASRVLAKASAPRTNC